MNKYLKGALIAVVIIGVFLFSFFVTGKQSVEVIDYNDYQKIKDGDGFVYYGSKNVLEDLKTFSNEENLEMVILDPADLSKSEIKAIGLEEGTIYLYNDGKVEFEYDGKINSEDLSKAFMEKGLIAKEYVSISLKQYLDIIKQKGYHLMFIGSEGCGYCTQFKESINESLEDYNYNVYYLSIDGLSEDDMTKLYATDSYFTEEEWGTPLTFLYKDGKVVDVLSGYVDANELVKFLKENKVV